MVPSYILDLMPPPVANVSHYDLRNNANLTTLPTRTATFSKSCIPSAISDWNNLPLAFRACGSYNLFCKELDRETLKKIQTTILMEKENSLSYMLD